MLNISYGDRGACVSTQDRGTGSGRVDSIMWLGL